MQDRLREIEGTLARTKERKNTILYKLSKRRQEEERLAALGVQQLPHNPYEVDDVKVVKYVLFRLKQELGEKIAHLRDAKQISVDKDGEAVVRAKNDEVNKLLSRKNQWNSRLAVLNGNEAPQQLRQKQFFGCAKELPEAEAARKRPRVDGDTGAAESVADVVSDDDGVVLEVENQLEDTSTQDNDYLKKVAWLGSSSADKELLQEEREAEAKGRAKMVGTGSPSKTSSFVLSYVTDGKVNIPDEEYFKNKLLEKRKKALQERLQALKKGK